VRGWAGDDPQVGFGGMGTGEQGTITKEGRCIILVLSRKASERIILRNHATGERIVVTQVRVGPQSSRLGFEAANHWDIVREELIENREQQTEAAPT